MCSWPRVRSTDIISGGGCFPHALCFGVWLNFTGMLIEGSGIIACGLMSCLAVLSVSLRPQASRLVYGHFFGEFLSWVEVMEVLLFLWLQAHMVIMKLMVGIVVGRCSSGKVGDVKELCIVLIFISSAE